VTPQNTVLQAVRQGLIGQSGSSFSTSNLLTFVGIFSGCYVILHGQVSETGKFFGSSSSKNVKTFALKLQFLSRK
jgi:hypothetical protein